MSPAKPMLSREMRSVLKVVYSGAKTAVDDTLLSVPGDNYATHALISHFKQIRVKPGKLCNTQALELGVLSHALTTSRKLLSGFSGALVTKPRQKM